MTNHNNYTILYNLMILMFIIQYIICCMNSISSNQQLQYYLANLYEFARYHLISLIVIFIISSIIFVRYYGTNKNKAIALKYHALLMPLLSKWFRKNDGQLIYESPNIIKMYPSDR